MNSGEKIEYVLHKVREKAGISPEEYFFVDCSPLIDIEANGGVPDGAPTLISCNDQVNILRKFENDKLISVSRFEKDYRGAWIALAKLDRDSNNNPYKRNTADHTDLDRGIFFVKGKSVLISTKAGKENNPLRLLKTIMKAPQDIWFEDQILEDWEGLYCKDHKKHIPRTRLYFSARNLNLKIFEQANIRDFILFDTKKFQINPMYFKDF